VGRRLDGLKQKMPWLHKFLTRADKPWPVVRELTFGILGLLLIVSLLFGLTGQPLKGGYPVVVVTSGSMMHCSNGIGPDVGLGKDCHPDSYGRLGTIDPGDLVFVKKTHSADDISTLAGGGGTHYGKGGDVVVYRPHRGTLDQHVTPVIHRALFYLEVGQDGKFSVPALGIYNVDDPEQDPRVSSLVGGGCNLVSLRGDGHTVSWSHDMSGFITRGDNNLGADQCASGIGFHYDPVTPAMILGKARGEVPWVGLVNLLVGDLTGNNHNFRDAGSDSKVMLVLVVVVLVATPYVVSYARRRRGRNENPSGDQP
jgi:signal peptidase I